MLFRLFAVLLLATAWFSGMVSGCAWAQEPLKIGLSGPFTGGSASNGAGIRDGANLAAEEINAAGGIDVGGTKRRIQLIERDDQSKEDVGVKIAQELIEEQDVIATVGFSNTGVASRQSAFLPGSPHSSDELRGDWHQNREAVPRAELYLPQLREQHHPEPP